MVKAIGLLSGGLDSLLAASVLKEQGIEVTAISFQTPFFSTARARVGAEKLGIPLMERDITAPHLQMLKAPRYGFGANMNPCIDCHIIMVKEACGLMRKGGFDFVFTGEVLNERPMSQNRRSLRIVEKESGCDGYLLRPLSAKLLDETIPEKEGKVDRTRLLAISGRSRKPQIAMAEKYGLKDYPAPAGGCLLTDPGFSRKLRELIEHEGLDDVKGIQLLKVGRHFRLESGRKVVVGRNEGENERLERHCSERDLILEPMDIPGPTVIIPGGAGREDLMQAARLCARYSDAKAGETVGVVCRNRKEQTTLTLLCPANDEIGLRAI